MSSTVSCSSAAHRVSVSSRRPAQIFATPTGCTMKSSPDLRRWSAWCSQAKMNAASTRSRSIGMAASSACSSTIAKRSESSRCSTGGEVLAADGLVCVGMLDAIDGHAGARLAIASRRHPSGRLCCRPCQPSPSLVQYDLLGPVPRRPVQRCALCGRHGDPARPPVEVHEAELCQDPQRASRRPCGPGRSRLPAQHRLERLALGGLQVPAGPGRSPRASHEDRAHARGVARSSLVRPVPRPDGPSGQLRPPGGRRPPRPSRAGR